MDKLVPNAKQEIAILRRRDEAVQAARIAREIFGKGTLSLFRGVIELGANAVAKEVELRIWDLRHSKAVRVVFYSGRALVEGAERAVNPLK